MFNRNNTPTYGYVDQEVENFSNLYIGHDPNRGVNNLGRQVYRDMPTYTPNHAGRDVPRAPARSNATSNYQARLNRDRTASTRQYGEQAPVFDEGIFDLDRCADDSRRGRIRTVVMATARREAVSPHSGGWQERARRGAVSSFSGGWQHEQERSVSYERRRSGERGGDRSPSPFRRAGGYGHGEEHGAKMYEEREYYDNRG